MATGEHPACSRTTTTTAVPWLCQLL